MWDENATEIFFTMSEPPWLIPGKRQGKTSFNSKEPPEDLPRTIRALLHDKKKDFGKNSQAKSSPELRQNFGKTNYKGISLSGPKLE